MEHKAYYTLPEIAGWDEEQKVSLPTVQRGFVWKPAQIENLWDSLLRVYPVGAFVLSDAGNSTLHILDGQQRATAICLGFAKETFRDSQDYYKVFIDLELPEDDSRKYIFRVITKSHPWGYRRQENTKTLTAENIRNAMDMYESVPDPLNTTLVKFFPYDAGLPVPLHYFLNAAAKTPHIENSELIKKIKGEYQHWVAITKNWKKDNAEALSKRSEQEIEKLLDTKINSIYKAVKEMLHPSEGQKIPALYINLDKVMNTEGPADEVENLFVRLNSGGTQLSGEELNYSILKAHLQREVQDEIEDACKQLFKPARFIAIAYRLYQQENKEEKQSDALTMRIKPKQFQRTIRKKGSSGKSVGNRHAYAKDFETYLLQLIQNKYFEEKTLLDYAQSVLEYDTSKKGHYGLPFLIYSKISDVAPELMFLILYRIKYKHDRFSDKNENEHRTMLGMITLFMWFGKGENLKDHSKLLSNIWPAASTLDKERFWTSETVERAHLNDVLLPFPAFKSNKQDGLERIWGYVSEKTNMLNRLEKKLGEKYHLFLQKIIYNRDIILYAQRHFIESYFPQQQYRLEDTSLPFDWDHISPNNFVRTKKNIPRIVKDWYQTNGNYRAWPYALNRMDSDSSPAYKLNPLVNYENKEETGYKELEAKWQQFINSNQELIANTKQISEKLTEWSFCDQKWTECFVTDIRSDWKPVTSLIVYRNFELINEWYEQLHVGKLRKDNQTKMEYLLDNRKWSKLTKKNQSDYQEFDFDEYVNHISSAFTIGNSSLNFYISYPDGENCHLEENKIEFGLFELSGNGYIHKMKNNTEYEMDTSKYKWILKTFTLVSGHFNSYKVLVCEITEWLTKLPVSDSDQKILTNQFMKLLTSKFKHTLG